MGRLFGISLEELSETIDELPTEEVTESDIEETTVLESEVDKDVESIEESIVVLDSLQDASKLNDKLLEDGNIVATQDVMVSEECYKEACYKLGYPIQTYISFSTESRSSNRELLKISNEGIKEVVLNIIVTLRNLLRRVIAKIKMIYTKLLFRLKKYQISIENKVNILKSLDISTLDIDRIVTTLRESKCAELQYTLINSTPALDYIYNKSLTKIASAITLFIVKFRIKDKIVKFFGLDNDPKKKLEDMLAGILGNVFGSNNKLDISKYGFKKPNITGTLIPVITGSRVAVISNYVDIRTINLDPDQEILSRVTLDVNKLVKSLTDPSNVSIVKKGAIESGRVINEIAKLQDIASSIVDTVDNKSFAQKHPDEIKLALNVVKGTCVSFSMLALKSHLNTIKYYNLLLSILISSVKKD